MNKEKVKTASKNICIMVIIFFFCGVLVAIGAKTVDHIWPGNNEIKIVYEHKIIPEIPVYDEIPEDENGVL